MSHSLSTVYVFQMMSVIIREISTDPIRKISPLLFKLIFFFHLLTIVKCFADITDTGDTGKEIQRLIVIWI